MTKGFDDAHRGKVVDLRVLTRNPAKGVRGPDRGVDTEKVHLYPAEFSKLMACDAVPVFRRRYYAIAVYSYLRPGELEALHWDDINERDIIHICHGIDRSKGIDKAPKAGRARSPFDLELAIVPLLRVMRADARGKGYVVGRLGDERALAETLRADLLVAGVHRWELHNGSDDPPREWMTMHDLRTTGITWMAVRGDEPLIVMARAGHSDFKTTLGYVNRAALIRRSYGAPFPKLPAKLLKRASLKEGFPETFPERNRQLRGTVELFGGNAWESNRRKRRDPAEPPGGSRTSSDANARGSMSRSSVGSRGSPETSPETSKARVTLVSRIADTLKAAFRRGDLPAAAALAEELRGIVREEVTP